MIDEKEEDTVTLLLRVHQKAAAFYFPFIIHTVAGVEAGGGVHIVFVGTDCLAAFVDSFLLKVEKHGKKTENLRGLLVCEMSRHVRAAGV